MMAALGGVEMAMIDAGIKFTPGSGTGAAAKYLTSNPDKTKKNSKQYKKLKYSAYYMYDTS